MDVSEEEYEDEEDDYEEEYGYEDDYEENDYEENEEDDYEENEWQLFNMIDKSPEEAVKIAIWAIVNGWYHDSFDPSLTIWSDAKELITALMEEAKHGLDSEGLLDRLKWFADMYRISSLSYLYHNYFSGTHLNYLWRKLTEEQKEAFLKDLYHALAKEGLIEFLRTVGKRKLSLKDINNYLNGKISFRDLMDKLARKCNIYDKPKIAEDFWNAVDLAAFLSDEELKKIVKDCVLNAKLKELEKRKQKRK